ncbi:hypothetical protein [Runella aurantiaca]|uniref:Lipopolysaccharide biosynthesis protein n=1 Tax=Runella aurantiaca TaxID=2282308 RepID=A0A369I4E6_9BACT|nr:hypothetical protein [Runella aurantiaca]RDB04599.1 hypothetical protein DVG78_18090 [Runella aurantiaca]
MEQQQQEQVTLSPKLIFQKIIQAKDLILKNWWLILILVGVGTAIGYYVDSEKNKRVQYVSEIIFNVTGSGATQDLGGLGSLLGGMGGGRGDAGLFTGENLFYVIKTRPVLERALLTPITLSNGKKELFVNYYLDSTFIRQDDWGDFLKEWLPVRIQHTKRDSMSRLERQVFDGVLYKIRDREITIGQPNIKTAFYELTVSMENEGVSKVFIELLLSTVERVYQETQTRKSREMMGIMRARVDSLGRVLNRTESQLAKTTVINVEAVAPTAKVAEGRLTRSTSFVTALYLEASRSLESLQMSIVKESPLFTIIEPVVLPLETKLFTRENTKFGAILGFIVAVIFVLAKQTYSEALKDMKKK